MFMSKNRFTEADLLRGQELNEKPYEVKISYTVLKRDSEDDLSVDLSTINLKNPTSPYVKLLEHD